MTTDSSNAVLSHTELRSGERARAGIIVLALTAFVFGLAASALWHFRGSSGRGKAAADDEQRHELSESSKAVLNGLNAPVEIRFYSLLDPASVSESLRAFATRVEGLLSEYEQEAGGKLAVKRFNHLANDADAALADGIKPFNFAQGDLCFLGLVIDCNDRKEIFSKLEPQWETALEPDLTRAIQRMNSVKPSVKAPHAESPISAQALEEVKRSIPNIADVSLEDGTRMLREAAMEELKAALNELEIQVEDAKKRFTNAQSNNSEVEQQAALKQLRQSQALQAEKLKEIAARLQAQIAALELLKSH